MTLSQSIRSDAPGPAGELARTDLRRTVLIGIAGGTGAGTTTCAERLVRIFATNYTAAVVDLDSYSTNGQTGSLGSDAFESMDLPDAIDFKRMQQDLLKLRGRQAIVKPITRTGVPGNHASGVVVMAADIVIAEGSMLFINEEVREMFDIKIFVDTPPDIRLRRRLERDVRERRKKLAAAIDHYMSRVLPVHDRLIEPTRRYAEFLVPGSQHTEELLIEVATAASELMRTGMDQNPGKSTETTNPPTNGVLS